MLGQRFPNLARHLSLLAQSWEHQKEVEAAAPQRSDHEFLQGALAIIEKPPSPGYRYLMLGLCGLLAVALLWSIIGKVDVVATAGGKVVPAGQTKIVQAAELGTVRTIRVRNGQHVLAGQILVELDPTVASAEASQASGQLLAAELAAARSAALLAHIEGRPVGFAVPAATPPDLARTQADYVRAMIAEHVARRSGLEEQRRQHAAQLAAAQAELAKLVQSLPLVEQQLTARRTLTQQGHFSKLRLLEYEQLRLDHVQNIAVQRANVAQATAALASARAQIAEHESSFRKLVATQYSDARQQTEGLRQEVRKTAYRGSKAILRAPVSGTVEQLAIATVGGVVEPAQPLMVIVPDDRSIFVEARILNKDIGFIREGQAARVKFDAFPFTDHGIVPAVVESVSRDAMDMAVRPARDSRPAGGAEGPVYAARIRLLRSHVDGQAGPMPIRPGMTVQAEIKTGERRIIAYLLSPLARTFDEAGRER